MSLTQKGGSTKPLRSKIEFNNTLKYNSKINKGFHLCNSHRGVWCSKRLIDILAIFEVFAIRDDDFDLFIAQPQNDIPADQSEERWCESRKEKNTITISHEL